MGKIGIISWIISGYPAPGALEQDRGGCRYSQAVNQITDVGLVMMKDQALAFHHLRNPMAQFVDEVRRAR